MKKLFLTIEQLQFMRVDEEEIKAFKKTFGKSMEVTEKNCSKLSDKIDFHWLAQKMFSEKVLKEYSEKREPLYKQYFQALRNADKEYNSLNEPVFIEYKAINEKYKDQKDQTLIKESEKKYLSVNKLASENYSKTMKPIVNEFDKNIAFLFAQCYILNNS